MLFMNEGSPPITYLGLPLHWKKPCLVKRKKMIDKIEKKLTMWKSNTLSLGGRFILLNSVLTAMPLYL